MNLSDGEYFIRCNVGSPDQSFLWFISGPTATQTEQEIHAFARSICRDTRTKKIRERDLPPECFVQVINRDNGTILLRQTATGRYATVNTQQTYSFMAGQEGDDPAPKISFMFFSDSTRPPKDNAEFQLIAPTGKVSNGVAIRSMRNNRYVEVDLDLCGPNYLYPICDFEHISANGLFRFERRFGYF